MNSEDDVYACIEPLTADITARAGLGAAWRRLGQAEREQVRDEWMDILRQHERADKAAESLIEVLNRYGEFDELLDEMPEENHRELQTKWSGILMGACSRFTREKAKSSEDFRQFDPHE